MKITYERVRELFDYRDGKLIWKEDRKGNAKAGSEAGVTDNGYRLVCFDGEQRHAHRLIWLWHYGYFPEHDIDHINRNRGDDRIENLREVTRSCNLRNTGNPRNNVSGVKGVSRLKSGKWVACIKVRMKTIHLGSHNDFTEAVCHRLAAEQAEGWDGCDSESPAFKHMRSFVCDKNWQVNK